MLEQTEYTASDSERDNFPYFSIKTYIVTPHKNGFCETVLMRGHNICFIEI